MKIISHDAYPLMYTVAILHDVDDKKEDPNEIYRRQMRNFLRATVTPQLEDFIIATVERVSMSNEVINGSSEWSHILGAGLVIRHYVSDADKLLCLGKDGHKRVVEYNVSKIARRVFADCGDKVPRNPYAAVYEEFSDELIKNVSDIMRTRMRYVPNYLRTNYARVRAVSMMEALNLEHEAWLSTMHKKQ